MHIASPHQQDGIQSILVDSDYDTPQGDVRLSEPTPSTTGPVMQNQTLASWPKACRAHGLRWSHTFNRSRRTTFQSGWQSADDPCLESEYWLSIA